jgi:sRNA-binding protein
VRADEKLWERRGQSVAVCALLDALGTRYPRAFGRARKTLAAGQVRRILDETGCDPVTLRAALRFWCGSLTYLTKASTKGAWRFDLDGNLVAPQSEAERAEAAARLAALYPPLRNG